MLLSMCIPTRVGTVITEKKYWIWHPHPPAIVRNFHLKACISTISNAQNIRRKSSFQNPELFCQNLVGIPLCLHFPLRCILKRALKPLDLIISETAGFILLDILVFKSHCCAVSNATMCNKLDMVRTVEWGKTQLYWVQWWYMEEKNQSVTLINTKIPRNMAA